MSEKSGDETGLDEVPDFWFNLKTQSVERGLLSAAPFRIGPFRTESEAANALEIIRQKAKAWQEEDEKDSR
jgi:hypothetical protein